MTSTKGEMASQRSTVVDLAEVRVRRDNRWLMPLWAQWGGMAASLLLGAILATVWSGRAPDATAALYQDQGHLVAGGNIDQGLSTTLASEPHAGATVSVQLSFVDKIRNYCRNFSTGAVAGLACRRGEKWTLNTIAAVEPPAAGDVRPAASALPRAVLDAVDLRIDGAALDGDGERSARDHSWHR